MIVSMNFLWIVLAVGIVRSLAKWLGQRHEPGWNANLGFVSQQWVAEHRLAETSDHG